MAEIIYEGIPYTVAEGTTLEELMQKSLPDGRSFADVHEENVRKKVAQLAQPTPQELQLIQQEKEKSGVADALLSGMSNDTGYQIAWLAQKRFPDLVEQGINPADYYFLDEDEEISYIDPQTGEPKKEFTDDLLVDIASFVGPTLQFFGEAAGGTLGLMGGATTGTLPGAMAGGSGGTAVGGSAAGALRAGISAAFDGPALNVSDMVDDLMVSSAFGAIPFGVKKELLASKGIFRTAAKKFSGKDGRTVLQQLVDEGTEDAEKLRALAKERFDVELTPAEAQGIVGNKSAIQRYLQMQPGSQKLWEFYHNRQMQIEDTAEQFFDQILSGKYLPALKRQRLSGKVGIEPELDLAEVSNEVLKKLADKRQIRATPVYNNSFELPIEIDVSDIASELRKELGDQNLRGEARRVKQALLDSLVDYTGFSPSRIPIGGSGAEELGLKNNTELLHNALKNDIRPLIEGLTKEGQLALKREVTLFRNKISNRMKVLNPEYARATAIYDPSKGHLQALERSVINNLAKAAELGGESAARLTNKLFNGTISPKQVRDLRRLIQTEDPQVWQNMKANWLRTQFDDAVASSINPLGANNKFLSRIGVRGKRALGRGAEKVRGTKAKLLQEIMDPEELNNFVDLVEIMQAVSFISTQTGSPTQPLLALQKILERDATGLGQGVYSAIRSLAEIPQRVLIRGFDDITQKKLADQRESYEDTLINALIDPSAAADLAAAIGAVKPGVYFVTQAAAGGANDAIEAILNDQTDQIDPATGRIQRSTRGMEILESAREIPLGEEEPPAEETQDIQSQIDSMSIPQLDGDIFEPLPQTGSGAPQLSMLGPTILPSDEDRELAERLRMTRSGIGGLMV